MILAEPVHPRAIPSASASRMRRAASTLCARLALLPRQQQCTGVVVDQALQIQQGVVMPAARCLSSLAAWRVGSSCRPARHSSLPGAPATHAAAGQQRTFASSGGSEEQWYDDVISYPAPRAFVGQPAPSFTAAGEEGWPGLIHPPMMRKQ